MTSSPPRRPGLSRSRRHREGGLRQDDCLPAPPDRPGPAPPRHQDARGKGRDAVRASFCEGLLHDMGWATSLRTASSSASSPPSTRFSDGRCPRPSIAFPCRRRCAPRCSGVTTPCAACTTWCSRGSGGRGVARRRPDRPAERGDRGALQERPGIRQLRRPRRRRATGSRLESGRPSGAVPLTPPRRAPSPSAALPALPALFGSGRRP
jgi:hypothetical protein